MSFLELSTAGGPQFDVRHFSVHEGISDPLFVSVLAVSLDSNVDLEGMVDKPASLKVTTGYANVKGGSRTFEGICSHAERVHGQARGLGGSDALSTYSIQIVSNIWRLTHRRGHRWFQHMSVIEIVDKLLGEWDIVPKWKVDRGAHPKLEYRCQYGDSDYAFLNRLLEEAGIAYITSDGEGSPAIVMSDAITTQPLRNWGPLHYEQDATESAQMEYASHVQLSQEIRHGKRSIADYDFRNPSFRMMGEANSANSEAVYEHYEYRPGAFLIEGQKSGETPVSDDKGVARHDAGYGKKHADRTHAARRGGRRTISFTTNVIDLAPGSEVTIATMHERAEFNKPLVVVSKEVSGSNDGRWNMHVQAVFKDEPYRPALRTQRPRIYGVQSAKVVGPPGEEIYVDEFGRVRVQFPWDREGKFDDNSSCWMRVSQGWAGTHFGLINLPRVGQEVLVAFLDGDPDQPIVVGRVFNALEPVPYKLPENKTVSAWKTCSSPASGGYNEYKIEDKKDKEFIYVRAQRDRHELVKRDEVARIERNHLQTILENQHLTVVKIKKEWIKEDDHLHVERDRFQKIDKSTSLTVGVDQLEKVGNKHALDAGKEIHLKAGDHFVMEAGSRLTIKGPGGFVDIHDGGVDIVGKIVNINSGGSAGRGSGSDPVEPKDADEALPKDTSVE